MKKILAIAALTAMAGSAFAQLSTLPPSSSLDGVAVSHEGVNAGATHWDANPGLASYKFASDIFLAVPNTGAPDNVLGLNWSASMNPAVTAALADIAVNGGFVRAIFTGESAGWMNDFGYSRSGLPAGPNSFTVFTDIQAAGPTPNIAFGDNVLIGLAKGEATSFDFWLNGAGAFGTVDPLPPTDAGGTYTVFHPSNSNPWIAPGNVRYAQSPLMVNTSKIFSSGFEDVATYLVSIEDWRLDRGSDRDYNDFMFGLQFYDAAGNPKDTPVPEPSTYGLIGGVALLGLVARRRFKAKK